MAFKGLADYSMMQFISETSPLQKVTSKSSILVLLILSQRSTAMNLDMMWWMESNCLF